MNETYRKVIQYINKYKNFDLFFFPLFFIIGAIWLSLALYGEKWEFSTPLFRGFMGGIWIGLGIASLIRYVYGKKIYSFIEKNKEK